MKIKIVGSGLSGITCAILLKERGHQVEIFESRNHIGGNCHDSNVSGTMMHNYGPHIFHTDDEDVFSLLSRYTEWTPFSLQPKGNTYLGEISLPYSKKTIKEIGRELTQDEIVDFIFKDYSEKQWGVPFHEIPKSITNRIPKTANCEDPTWFEGQKYQCIPKYGYTEMMKNMLDGITVHVGVDNDEWKNYEADLTIFTGKIDGYYNCVYGKLPYRSLEFRHHMTEHKQSTFMLNQNRKDVPYTRMYDHSYFTFNHKGPTIITQEFSIAHNDNNIPFYPIPFGEGDKIYTQYKELADKDNKVMFVGRLATYKYLDMWMAIKQAMLKIENAKL